MKYVKCYYRLHSNENQLASDMNERKTSNFSLTLNINSLLYLSSIIISWKILTKDW